MDKSQKASGGDIAASKLSLVASNTRNTVIITDAQHRIEWVNESFRRHYGYELEDCRGLPSELLIPPAERIVPPDGQAAAGHPAGVARRSEIVRYDKDGRKRWLEVECRPIIDEQGAVSGYIEIESDITERKRAEAELQMARQLAESANLAKSEFLATICHEIRNPVNVMVGMMELALQTKLTAEQKEYLNLIKTSSDSLLSVVNDTLDLAKIESGCLDVECIRFSLRESIGDAMKMLAFQAHRKGLVLACDIAPEVPDDLLGDPMRLRQILLNLVGNAIKFTERGDVVVRVGREADDAAGVSCRFAVTDSGPGIPEDRQTAVFEPYLQADPSIARKHGGTGLGLTIAARLARMMDGRLWLESRPGAGSTFTFTARFRQPAGAPADAPAVDGRGLRALVADGHPVNRRYLAETLRRWQIEVHEADSAPAALELLAQARAAQRPYRLALLDAALDAGGHALAAQLARDPVFADCHVVFLEGTARMPADESFRDPARFSSLVMPAKHSELVAMATAASGAAPACAAACPCDDDDTKAAAQLAAMQLSVLLVDDDSLNRRLARLHLEKAGCRVLLADGAASAFALLAGEQPDLVLMDMQMPALDGAEATRRIRAREAAGGRLPIVALSACVTDGERQSCLAAGMDGCLSKPLRPAKLLALVRELQQAGHLAAAEAVLDREALLASVGGDRLLLAEIVGMFPAHCGRLMRQLRDAIAGRDADRLAHAAHTLLGMFRTLYALSAQRLVAALETLAVDVEPERAAALHAQLERAVKRLGGELAALVKAAPAAAGARPPHHHPGTLWPRRKAGALATPLAGTPVAGKAFRPPFRTAASGRPRAQLRSHRFT